MPGTAVAPDRLIKSLVIALATSFLAACSMLNHPWGKADDYVEGLRCGMSEDALRTYSKKYPEMEVRSSDKFDYLVARKGNTQILLWLNSQGLNAYRVTWTYPPTNFGSELKTDVCSGEQYVELDLMGSSDLAGTAIWLDEERVGELSQSGSFTWDVTLGVHQLRVERPDGESWTTELRYDAGSGGHDRLLVPEDALPP